MVQWLYGVVDGVQEDDAGDDGASSEGGLLGAEGWVGIKVGVVGEVMAAAAVRTSVIVKGVSGRGGTGVPLTLGVPLLSRDGFPTRVRCVCSWSNSRSSSFCVRASFCWMAMRRREFNVFFSSSAAASCLCISSS